MPNVILAAPRPGPNTETASAESVSTVLTGRGGAWLSVQLTGPFVATVLFEQSNNGATWVALPLVSSTAVLGTAPVITATAVGVWHGPCAADQYRVRISAFTSGTVALTVAASSNLALHVPPIASTTVDTELPTAAVLSDTIANPTTAMVGGAIMLYNGTTWERARTVGGATGIGVQAVNTGSGVLQSFAAGSTAIANGVALSMGAARNTHTMVLVATGTPTTGTVQMQGSLDGTSWFSMGAAQSPLAAGVTQITVTDINAIQVRAIITVAFTGGAVEVKLASSN